MGDTGSLFLGAIISACAVSLGNPLLIALLGSVYVIEGASVIIQVASFKLTGKRVFKMAPLHHHLEKSGFCENTIVIIAIVFTLISSIFAVYLYL
jgi:phospho-N-acetylmuramoyl-pentapeptide-transferase